MLVARASHSSSSIWKRPWAWLACSSRKPQHQRTGQAEQRGAERRRHALERTFDAALQLGEHRHGVARRRLQAVDGIGHGADRLQQAPERAEQAEEDQQADQIARQLAPLVEPRGDAVEQGAGRRRREAELVLAFAQHRCHRRQQVDPVGRRHWRIRLAVLKAAQPAHFGPQQNDLAEDEEDADRKHAQNHRVEVGRVHEHPHAGPRAGSTASPATTPRNSSMRMR